MTCSFFHCVLSSSSPRIVAAIFAPNAGGLDTSARCNCSKFDCIAAADAGDLAVASKIPTRSPSQGQYR